MEASHSSDSQSPTSSAGARILSQVSSYMICGGESETGIDFLRVSLFSHRDIIAKNCPIFINHPIQHCSVDTLYDMLKFLFLSCRES
jgi:hypothetical protein